MQYKDGCTNNSSIQPTELVQGVCPSGWHVPSDAEWTTLTDSLGGLSVAGGKMKETGTTHWNSPNTGATSSSGFTAFGSGYHSYSDNYYYNQKKILITGVLLNNSAILHGSAYSTIPMRWR